MWRLEVTIHEASVECVPGCHCCRFQYILPLIQVINFAGRSETPAAKSRSIVHIFPVLAGSSRSRPKHAGGDKCCTNVNIVYILSRTEVKGWILLIIARQKYRTDQIIDQRKSRSLKIQAKYTGVDIVHNIFFLSLLGLSQDYSQLQSDLAPAYNFLKMAQCEYNI